MPGAVRPRATLAYAVVIVWGLGQGLTLAATLELRFPLGRAAYQTNETIDLAAVRSDAAALAAGELRLTVTGDDGSSLSFAFPVEGAAVRDGQARATEHLHLNARLLRPGNYTVEAACDGATAQGRLDVHSHLRKSSFTITDWSWHGETGRRLQVIGEESMGYNVTYKQANGDESIRGGLRFMRGMVLGGAHQLDANLKNDWSDPYVLREGRIRASREAMKDRTQPNCIGVHFYDEPGLTWNKHPETDEFVPYNIAAQDRAWKGARGSDAPQYNKVAPNDPASVERWREMNRWKLGFMEACWKHVSSGVNLVRPDWLTATQSQYGWDAFSDGYYFNIARSLPVINGHGWYSDVYWLNLAPPMASEFGRMRDWHRPCWYMPTWWQMNTAHTRMEQAMSFIQGLEGMMWPGSPAWAPSQDNGMPGIVEMNRLMLRLGTVFTTMPVDRSPVALLYSISQGIESQIRSGMKDTRYSNGHIRTTLAFYAASMRNQTPLLPVVEEDILDGTVAANHKAIILSKVEYLDPKVIRALEDYAAGGGKVLLDNECKAEIKGAEKLGLQMDYAYHNQLEGRHGQEDYTTLNFMKNVEQLAKDLRKKLGALGIQPVFNCDSLDILGRRQAYGDIEYLFAVNMSPDAEMHWKNTVRGTVATIGVPDDGRPLYDAILGGEAAGFERKGKELRATLRFGVGQMRAFARTARPIGGVAVLPPAVTRDYVADAQAPMFVEVIATLVDAKGQPLAGSAPMQVRLVDPLGDARHDLYRATDRGLLRLRLPLAANDPEGEWTIEVIDLLAGAKGTARFALAQPRSAGAVAGMTHRAVMFGDDFDKTGGFFRRHRRVTLLTGSSDFNAPAAQRLAENLKLWGVECDILPAADAKKDPQPEWAKTIGCTWSDSFAVPGPCVLLGSPDDNPILKFLTEKCMAGLMQKPTNVLPYMPAKDVFPGRGRGFVAWQIDCVGHGVESLACIAYDAEGMAEAAGTLFEAASNLRPLTEWVLPASSRVVAAAKKQQTTPPVEAAWIAQVPDRAIGMAALGVPPSGGLAIATFDGTLTAFDAAGKKLWEKTTEHSGEHMAFAASPDGRTLVVSGGFWLAGFDASGKELFDKKVFPDDRRQFVTTLAVAPDGETIYAGTGDSCVIAFDRRGRRRWITQEPSWAEYTKAVEAFKAEMRAWERKKDPNAPDKPKPPNHRWPDPCRRVVLSSDGKTLLAAASKGAHLYDAAKGEFLGPIAGVNGVYPILAEADGFLAHDGKKSVQRVSVADRKVAKGVALPAAQLVALVRRGDGWLLGTESDGAVRLFSALPDKLGEAVWTSVADTRIVKEVHAAGDTTAVVYWGGTVRVLDAKGGVKAETLLPNDCSATALAGGRLVAALADGRVVALKLE
ncbi:MAG TPA: PQQ-binding-like beta-propeller repeat protein [Planctomycetota bacterium]|nr:PQQ-binding-like beta-propeller repeat protein [Planctomycetota bacterium]